MEQWKEYKLSDILSIVSGFAYKGEYLGKGESLLLGMGCVSYSELFLEKGMRPYAGEFPERYSVEAGDIVLATRQQSDNLPILGMPAIVPQKFKGKKMVFGANLYKVVPKSPEFPIDYIYWLLKTPAYIRHIRSCQTGTTVRMITKANIEDYAFMCPCKEQRNQISKLLWDIEMKIVLNRRINDNLEQQAQALFDHYFDSGSIYLEDSIMGCLTDIAVYLNGLAMQKFPATDIERSLPVLKIKELGQRKCDDCSDRCSDSIDADYIIDNEDIIFSWSGTLMVDVWCGGKCGLNQHLFKVTPLKNYPRWFVYYWTNRHLKKFKLIAKDKAVTMGHIRRGALENAEVAIPTNLNMLEINARINPLFQSIIDRRLEITKLENIRDALLPKLMSGELTINEI